MTTIYEPLLTRFYVVIDRLNQDHICPEFMVWSESWRKDNVSLEAKANTIVTRNFFEEKKNDNFLAFILMEGFLEMSLCVKIGLLYTTGMLENDSSKEVMLYHDMEILIGGLELQMMIVDKMKEDSVNIPPPGGTTIH